MTGVGVGVGLGGVPVLGGASWVSPGAVLDLNFADRRYWLTDKEVAFPATTMRASTAWAFDNTGVLQEFAANQPRILSGMGLTVEEARTNLFLNSDTPTTQAITVANTTEYTVTLWGAGSATLSGALTGTATAGVLVTGTTTTTSLTVTVTDSPDYVQVEVGGFGTSPIITAGAPATRAADAINLTDVSWLNPQNCTVLVEFEQIAPASGTQTLIRWSNVDWHRLRSGNVLYAQVQDGAGNSVFNKGYGAPPPAGIHSIAAGLGINDMAVAWSASLTGAKGISNDGSGVPEPNPLGIYIGSNGAGGSENLNGRLRRIVGWQARKSDADLLELA